MITNSSIANKSKKSTLQSAKKKLSPYVYLSPTIILMTVLMLIPIVMVILYSFKDNVIMNKNPVFAGIKHYVDIIKDGTFHQAIYNTLYFTVMSVIFHFVLGLSFAMLLNTKVLKPATKSLFRVIYVLPWVFTATIIAILWRLMLNPNGIINYMLTTANIVSNKIEWLSSTQFALHALTYINIWSGYPFFMISLLAGLQGIPAELYEAATIDGANTVQSFRYVTVAKLKPIIVSMAMLDFIWTVQQFPLVWMTTGGGPIHATEMLSTYTYKLAFSSYNFSQASASAVIVLILSMCMALFYVKNQKAGD
ncbi:carbohydrate ABC transporter permease [Ruminiclostridium cellobioparum]|uniref:ABC transporter, permease protein n=1 Tax=Ruminiclostridium cellobioparum subsp. termitidis CT1112 TaxID=1195236 RepID=S0FGN4_RUMCE|nr:sugar ABC transporter permease [Ruminiclostridium cellobioparum]EMS70292.1 ABC transporter, permease protein [Ruminiclostridium cellobioparum subsp. termitidis CT1112]